MYRVGRVRLSTVSPQWPTRAGSPIFVAVAMMRSYRLPNSSLALMLSSGPMDTGQGITLVAVVVTAVATAALAIINFFVIRDNKKIIAATQEGARASLASIDEIKRDRELGYRPFLSFEMTVFHSAGSTTPDTLHVVNVGRGPAINAMFALVLADASEWRRTRVFDAPSDDPEGGDLPIAVRNRKPPSLEILGFKEASGRAYAMFCEDSLGNCYRFHPRKTPPDVWHSGDGEPVWLKWFREEKPKD